MRMQVIPSHPLDNALWRILLTGRRCTSDERHLARLTIISRVWDSARPPDAGRRRGGDGALTGNFRSLMKASPSRAGTACTKVLDSFPREWAVASVSRANKMAAGSDLKLTGSCSLHKRRNPLELRLASDGFCSPWLLQCSWSLGCRVAFLLSADDTGRSAKAAHAHQ